MTREQLLAERVKVQSELARRDAERRTGNAARAARDSLAEFVRQGWAVVEPATPLVWNWHLDILCDALERQARGELEFRRLVICVPPGTMKSLLVSVFAPAREWLWRPERTKLFLSNDDGLSTRDARRMRELITSPWFRELVASTCPSGEKPWTLAYDQNEKVNFANTKHGFRECRSINSNLTGRRAADIVIDDPADAREVVNGSVEQVARRLEHVANVVDKILPSRVNDLADARWTLIMQRLHENDTAGRAIREGGWKVISLQMEFEPGNPLNHPSDPRREKGELLFAKKFPPAELAKVRNKLGPRHYSAQYQQRPLPADGGPLKRWYWRFWFPGDVMPAPPPVVVQLPDGEMHTCQQKPLPEQLSSHTQSWDMAFKDTKDSAYVVGQVWAQSGADSFMLDQYREKMDMVATLEAVASLSARWPMALEKLIEDKANGPAVMNMLRGKLPGLTEVEPCGGKEARANAAAPACRSGNVWLPHPSIYPWVTVLLDELEAFPGSEYADQVDSLTQYLIRRYGVSEFIFR